MLVIPQYLVWNIPECRQSLHFLAVLVISFPGGTKLPLSLYPFAVMLRAMDLYRYNVSRLFPFCAASCLWFASTGENR